MLEYLRRAALSVWRSNSALFILSLVVGFAVGAGCIVSSDETTAVPDDFRLVITSSYEQAGTSGRLSLDAVGIMRFDDWGTYKEGNVTVSEIWSSERVDEAYAILRENGFVSLRPRYPEGASEDYLNARSTMTVEGRMRGTYQVVHVITDDERALPESVRNIVSWYDRQTQQVRARIAASAD